jgi:hypothetical protein
MGRCGRNVRCLTSLGLSVACRVWHRDGRGWSHSCGLRRPPSYVICGHLLATGSPAGQHRETAIPVLGATVGSAPLLNLGEPDPLTVRSLDADNLDMYLLDQIARAMQSSVPGLDGIEARHLRSFDGPQLP